MESMYKEVAKAIEEEGVEKSPTDYLKFFCLGKRESPEVLETEGLELEVPPAGTVVEKVRNRSDYLSPTQFWSLFIHLTLQSVFVLKKLKVTQENLVSTQKLRR